MPPPARTSDARVKLLPPSCSAYTGETRSCVQSGTGLHVPGSEPVHTDRYSPGEHSHSVHGKHFKEPGAEYVPAGHGIHPDDPKSE